MRMSGIGAGQVKPRPEPASTCADRRRRSSGPSARSVLAVFRSPTSSSLGTGSAATARASRRSSRSEEHTSELQSRGHLVCRLLLEKKKKHIHQQGSDKKKNNNRK